MKYANQMLRLLVVLPILGCMTLIGLGSHVRAETTDLRLRILPLECVFNVIDIGTQQIEYVTPKECGQEIPEPEEPSTTPNTPIAIAPVVNQVDTVTPPSVPTVTSHESGQVIDGDTVVLTGQAEPGSQVTVLIDGAPQGTVVADDTGKWTFVYTATSTPVTFQFIACKGSVCSEASKPLVLSLKIDGKRCLERDGLTLNAYRFWNIAPNDSVKIDVQTDASTGVLLVDWGDGQQERFDINASTATITKTYTTEGVYAGSVSSLDGDCAVTRYFSVSVSNQRSVVRAVDVGLYALAVFGLIAVVRLLVVRARQFKTK